MSFSIRFVTAEPFVEESTGLLCGEGEIVLGDWSEQFLATLVMWSQDDYEAQWRKGLDRLIAGAGSSVLVTRILPIEHPSREVSEVWPFWRARGSAVFRQYVVLDLELDRLYKLAGRRFSLERPSGWRVPLDDIARFREQM